jgi:Co/Zn/Cd efflux system component
MADSCCGKSVDASALQGRQRRVLIIVLVINALTFLMMVYAALQARSSSVLSGGLDNLGDALTYALSLAVIGASVQAKARVAVFKGLLILGAAVAVAAQIVWLVLHPGTPVFEAIGLAGLANLAANLVCLRLLTPYRQGDINVASAYECSRNDVWEGFAVLAAAVGVWLFDSGWPDLVVASVLLLLFLRSAVRVLGSAWREMRTTTQPA